MINIICSFRSTHLYIVPVWTFYLWAPLPRARVTPTLVGKSLLLVYIWRYYFERLHSWWDIRYISGQVLASQCIESPKIELIPIDRSVFLPTQEASFELLLTPHSHLFRTKHSCSNYVSRCVKTRLLVLFWEVSLHSCLDYNYYIYVIWKPQHNSVSRVNSTTHHYSRHWLIGQTAPSSIIIPLNIKQCILEHNSPAFGMDVLY